MVKVNSGGTTERRVSGGEIYKKTPSRFKSVNKKVFLNIQNLLLFSQIERNGIANMVYVS